jgi:HAD superfamily hydrolase (TIGR01509 family)
MAIELVIFDCDGVLVDSERLANQVLAELLTELGLATTTDQSIATYMGLSMASVVTMVEERLGRRPPDDFLDRYRAATFAAFDRELRAVDGVLAVIEGLRWPSCVATSGDPDRVRRTLTLTDLHHHFEGRVFSAVEVPRGKPHPDLFLHAADRMGADPRRCVVVEDSPFGVRGARAAGMAVLGYAALTPAATLAAEGARTFTAMGELPGLLDDLHRDGGAPASAPSDDLRPQGRDAAPAAGD